MKRKLILRKEIIRALGEWELTRAAGGNTLSDVCDLTMQAGACPYPPTGMGPSCNCPSELTTEKTIKKPQVQ